MYETTMYQKMKADQTQHLEKKDFILKWQDLCTYTWLEN